MKKNRFFRYIPITLAFIFGGINNYAQEVTPSMQAWENLLDKPQLAEYFSDIFNHLGIRIEETNEEFTVNHNGDHFSLSPGIDTKQVDYIAAIKLENVQNMARHGADAEISEKESYQILSVLFTPLTEASLSAPIMNKPLMRKLSGIENHIHVYLISPEKQELNTHTLVFLNKKWIVIDGIYGQAKRVFNLTPEQALEYQKHMFRAMNQNKAKEWRNFKKWYKEWREEVSETI